MSETGRLAKAPTIQAIKRGSFKPLSAWWTVLLTDPIAIRITWLLMRLPVRVTPNFVTLLQVPFGLGAAWLFVSGPRFWWIGAILYQLSFTMDCVDGKLARMQGSQSKVGSFLDGLANTFVWVTGIGALIVANRGDRVVLVSGLALLALRGLNNYASIYIEIQEENVWAPVVPKKDSWLRRHRLMFPFTGPDRQGLMFVVGPLTGFVAAAFVIVAAIESGLLGYKVLGITRSFAPR